jgi:hypothetical protein
LTITNLLLLFLWFGICMKIHDDSYIAKQETTHLLIVKVTTTTYKKGLSDRDITDNKEKTKAFKYLGSLLLVCIIVVACAIDEGDGVCEEGSFFLPLEKYSNYINIGMIGILVAILISCHYHLRKLKDSQ